MNTVQNALKQWIKDPNWKFSSKAPGENGSTVEIVLDNIVYTVIVQNERWEWTPPTPLSEGEHTFSVRLIDAAGNYGAPLLVILDVDTQHPDAPLILQAFDDAGKQTGMLSPGDITDDKTPTLKGVAAPNSKVNIYDGDELIKTTTSDKNGFWEAYVELEDGKHELRAETVDSHDRKSSKSEPFTLIVEALPGGIDDAPVLDRIYDDVGAGIGDLSNGSKTNDNQPTLYGTGIAGHKVEVFDNGVLIGEAPIAADGSWNFTPGSKLAEGAHTFSVAHKGSDVKSPVWDITVDTIKPPLPIINAVLSEATEGIFIANGKTQQLLGGDEAEVAQWHAALNNSESGWTQQAGTLTVAGVQYQVYSQGESELLVQTEQF
ncbi:hypothetical protein K5Y32_18730 [Pantoea sp. DY-15]|uniref:Ig-like domain-containing protein n=1 Tax=unclassified Pantoea TaxID=2630326 RepID=UPI001C955B13|nr:MULTISPECIES: Ig-like domain-containing protein [unclassified Pantoea]MBY4838458.1 hypothetical protein [Pantoea sp. DY-5]MBY4889980.1 hypothetical protein [Pantoea sp. DY-15]